MVLEVVVFSDDCFGDEMLIVDAYSGQQGGAVRVGQPRDLGGLLEVLVLQVQASLHGHDLPISPSERWQQSENGHYSNATPHDSQERYGPAELSPCVLVDLGDEEVAPVDEGDHLALGQSLGVGSLDKNLRPIPDLLRAHLLILDGHTDSRFTSGDRSDLRWNTIAYNTGKQ